VNVAPDVGTLLDACDEGLLIRPAERGPWLVDRLGLAPSGVTAADCTVGACDLMLAKLRDQLFGPVLDLIGTCSGCGAEIECRIQVDDLWPHRADPAQQGAATGAATEVEVELGGRRFRCRLPSNRDLAQLACIEASRRPAEFVRRCVLDAPDRPGSPAAGGLQPDEEFVAALADVLAEHDPGAAALVELRCPCGATSASEVDIRSVLWAELKVWAERTLTEVHQLAWAYGWRESDILALPARRRQAYLERCGC
jgi:hypothetical protein